jgi:hypothetical protein
MSLFLTHGTMLKAVNIWQKDVNEHERFVNFTLRHKDHACHVNNSKFSKELKTYPNTGVTRIIHGGGGVRQD